MMNRRNALGLLLAGGAAIQTTWAFGKNSEASKIDKKKILKTLRLTNDYFVAKWPDTGKSIVTNRERPSNIWTRGVYYEGLMALYQIDKQQSYIDYAVSWGENHKWGLRNGIKTRNADDQCCGQTYIDLYLMDKKPERIRDIKASIDLMVNSGQKDDWSWIDTLQMAMPVFTQLAIIYDDNRYYEKMFDLYNHTKTVHGGKGLFNPEEGLWWRDKDFVPPYKTPGGKNCYWSRGNGWIVAALVRVLDIMPQNASHRDEYEKMLLTMLEALLPLQRKDGYWNVSLTDETDFGGKEVTGTSLFIYGMAWAIRKGLVKSRQYEPAITKAWNAMVSECVHENGFLGFVQGTGKEPKDGQPVTYNSMPDFEDFGLGCFLLAGAEIYKMK
jgi:unsaturated rhamnogalacturonyl hydrolase